MLILMLEFASQVCFQIGHSCRIGEQDCSMLGHRSASLHLIDIYKTFHGLVCEGALLNPLIRSVKSWLGDFRRDRIERCRENGKVYLEERV